MLPSTLQDHIRAYIALPADHPAKIGSRTYALALLLSLGPALLPFVAKVVGLVKAGKDVDRAQARKVVAELGRLFRQELGPFAFAITTAVAGGSFLQSVFETPQEPADLSLRNGDASLGTGGCLGSTFKNAKSRLWCYWTSFSDVQQAFLTNAVASTMAIALLQWKSAPGRRPDIPLTLHIPIDDVPRRKGISPTLNLTLILFVRALDLIIHGGLQDKMLQKLNGKGREVAPGPTEVEEGTSRDSVHAKDWINKWTSTLDSLVFCISSARWDRNSSSGIPH
jgi:hypothetical protein